MDALPPDTLPPDTLDKRPAAEGGDLIQPDAALAPDKLADESSGGSAALVRSHDYGARQEATADRASYSPLPEHLQQLRFQLELCVPLPNFTLRHLQDLAGGAVLPTEHSPSRDLVLSAAGERLMLVELEAVEQQLAARVKRLL